VEASTAITSEQAILRFVRGATEEYIG